MASCLPNHVPGPIRAMYYPLSGRHRLQTCCGLPDAAAVAATEVAGKARAASKVGPAAGGAGKAFSAGAARSAGAEAGALRGGLQEPETSRHKARRSAAAAGASSVRLRCCAVSSTCSHPIYAQIA